jgi:hypothetical protein
MDLMDSSWAYADGEELAAMIRGNTEGIGLCKE